MRTRASPPPKSAKEPPLLALRPAKIVAPAAAAVRVKRPDERSSATTDKATKSGAPLTLPAKIQSRSKNAAADLRKSRPNPSEPAGYRVKILATRAYF